MPDGIQVCLSLLLVLIFTKQTGHTGNAVNGSSDFVADVSQKLFLCFLQPNQFFGILLSLCDVAAVENEPIQFFLMLQIDGVKLQETVRLVFTEKLKFYLLVIGFLLTRFELPFKLLKLFR